MFYGTAVWDPWLIVGQIICLQCSFYLSLGVFMILFLGLRVPRLSLVYFFDYATLTTSTVTGWCVIASFLFTSLAGAVYMIFVVERARKCLDFSATLYIIHLYLCILNGGWPSSMAWWVVNGTGLAVMALLAEYLCIKREQREIPMDRFHSTSETRNQAQVSSKIRKSQICRSPSNRTMDPGKFVFRNSLHLELSDTDYGQVFRVRSAKFVSRNQWVVAGADDMFIRVYNYNTMDKIKVFEAHADYIRCVVVHPTLPYVLSSSDDMLIKLWDWEKDWVCTQIFEGHSHYVMHVTFNPKDTNTFASASLDRSIKIWNLGSPDPNFTLDAHLKGVNCVDYFTGGDKPYLITGSDDHTAKVPPGFSVAHKCLLQAVCFHPELPIIITGSEDGTVRIWHATTYRLENTLNYGLERVWAIGHMKGSHRVVIGYDEGSTMVKLGREIPVASMDNSGKIIWAKHNEIHTVNIKSVGTDEVTDGERLPLAVKELGTCDLYPQSLKHNPNGRFVVVCGDGEYIIYTALAWRNRSFGSALEFVWSSEGEHAVRESSSKIKIFSKNFQEKKTVRPTFSAERIFGGTLLAMCSSDFICFYEWAECRLIRRIDVTVKNLYWADSGDLVAIASDSSFYILKLNRDIISSYMDGGKEIDEEGIEDAFELLNETNERVRTGLWVGDCFIYTNSSWRLNYCVGGEVTTMYHLDRPMYLLGYLANQSRVYLIDKEFNIIGYTLLLSLIEYKTLVMRGDLEQANQVLPSIPKEHHNSVAHFLESRGMTEDALEVATDPDYRFELAIQLGRLEVAKDIAVEAQSESKWKQLGELAMSTGKLGMAEECMRHAVDLSGLLLLYSSLGDAEGLTKLAALAKEQGKNNVAFVCLFMLGQVEDCLHLLVESNRIPEAALIARSYLPSRVSEIVALWRKDLTKISPKAAESLADPEEYPNLFEDWQVALSLEERAAETRGVHPPAGDYGSHTHRDYTTLVEAFRIMQIEEEERLEHGDVLDEVGGEGEEENQEAEEESGDGKEENAEEEGVVVDADSTDSAVLVNGNESEEQWGMTFSSNTTAGVGFVKTYILGSEEGNEEQQRGEKIRGEFHRQKLISAIVK
ncbi:hypothetical protein Bca4012_100184 [Brassica carinata]